MARLWRDCGEIGGDIMSLPIAKSDDKDLMLMQTTWSAQLNQLLQNPCNIGMLLKEVSLVNGANVINHKLGRKLQGWAIVRKRASADIYDTQDTNNKPSLTLLLQSNANVTVDLYVF